jgi:hypothetical protein
LILALHTQLVSGSEKTPTGRLQARSSGRSFESASEETLPQPPKNPPQKRTSKMTNLKTWTRRSNAIKNATAALHKALEGTQFETVWPGTITAADLGTGDTQAWGVRVYFDNAPSEIEPLQAVLGDILECVAMLTETDVDPEADCDDEDGEFGPPSAQPDAEDAAAAKEIDLTKLDQFGLGTDEQDARCPHCGVNHQDNGWQFRDNCPGNTMDAEFICLACNGEWGPLVQRRSFKGRQSSLKGKNLMLIGGMDAKNPYRVSTLSHIAFEIVRNNPGLTFEEFVAKGGRVRTLQEDVKHGRVEAV